MDARGQERVRVADNKQIMEYKNNARSRTLGMKKEDAKVPCSQQPQVEKLPNTQ